LVSCSTSTFFSYLFLSAYRPHRTLHSFPTRRSSDLSFCNLIVKFILNDTSFYIINNSVASLLIKSSNKLAILFSDWYLDLIPVTPRLFHPEYRMHRNVR